MDTHAAHAPEAQGLDPHEASHPGPGLYIKIGVVLFVLTALEVAAYEVAHRPGALGTFLEPILVPVLLLLSAGKFALVAMYYMHLKQDSKLFSGLFVFPLIIAAVVIVSLIALFIYHYSYQRGML
ncbi:MAG TPA: cytochrome C oxidase subunit IV family protein [Gemmatimonadales bacterium]|nr:cytochrome C oxidase subunit IV family protein [Gemmatimonadales bacterium]